MKGSYLSIYIYCMLGYWVKGIHYLETPCQCHLAVTGPVLCPPLLPGPDLRAELIMSGIIPPGGRHNTTAVLPDNMMRLQ